MDDGNYIKVSRKILRWGWYKNKNTKVVFLHCLLMANWKNGEFEGRNVKRGSFISSIGNIAKELGMTSDEVRTAVKHLESTGELTKQSASKFTVFTVKNYDLYQEVPKQIPNKSQANPEQIPNDSQSNPNNRKKKERKEGKNVNKNIMCKTDALTLFESLWAMYPRKRGKGQVSEANKMRLLDIGFEELERAINRYKADLANETWRMPQNGSTFFNGGYIDYLDLNYRESKQGVEANEMKERWGIET